MTFEASQLPAVNLPTGVVGFLSLRSWNFLCLVPTLCFHFLSLARTK